MKIKNIVLMIILAVILSASFFSCRTVTETIYQTNKSTDVNEKDYIKKFVDNGIDKEKFFFIKKKQFSDLDSKYQFLKSFHSNNNYIYFGTVYQHNELLYFKKISGLKYGCNEVLMSLDNEAEYPFSQNNQVQNLFEEYHFQNINSKSLRFRDAKTVVLVYNFAEGNLFFKDTKQILNFIKMNNGFDYVVICTNFYDDEIKKFLP